LQALLGLSQGLLGGSDLGLQAQALIPEGVW
jgi:hypothetical protein